MGFRQNLPMATVLGIEVPDLPEGFVALETIVLVKGMMDDGMTLAVRYSDGLTKWETIGMLTAELDQVRKQLGEQWEGTDDDD